MFKKNEFVIYPGFGLSRVKDIASKMVDGAKVQMYVLEVVDSQLNIIMSASQNILRPVLPKAKILKLLKSKELIEQNHTSSWNRRFREFMELIKTGEFKDVLYVYKSLMQLHNTKDLSFGERKMIDHSQSLLVGEIAVSFKILETEAFNKLVSTCQ